MSKVEIDFQDFSEEIIDEIGRLTEECCKIGANIIIEEAKKNVKGYTGVLAQGLVVDDEFIEPFNRSTGNVGLLLGYQTKKSWKNNGGNGFYPNPSWIEFGFAGHTIQTKQTRNGEWGTYNLSDKYGSGQEFSFQVENPGYPGANYLRDAHYNKFEEAKSKMIEKINEIEQYEVKSAKKEKL